MAKVRDPRFRGTRALAIVVALSSIFPVLATAKASGLGASDTGTFNYGDAAFFGSTGSLALNKPTVGMAAAADGKGYWEVASDGGIFAYGDAHFYGSTGSLALNMPIVGMAATPTGNGYWLVASDGGIFAYGDAHFYGSTGSISLNKPVVGMAATPTGKGYWLAASDGGVFTYGAAAFYGSTGSLILNKPVVGMVATPTGKGYWLAASDGGVFTYGDAAFYGSTAGMALNKNIVGMAATPDGKGYWLVASSGGLSPPPGYTSQQMIFDDQFSGTSLDATKWTWSLGAQGIVWNNFGHLLAPYSGPNTPITTEAAMFSPSQLRVNNGLTLTAQRNTNQYASIYPWISGVVTTEGKFSLPASGWYVQVKAQMPDASQGMWPAIWFMPDTPSSPVPELDGYEGGATGGPPINQAGHSDYFAPQGEQQQFWNAGVDLSAGYHVYGFEYLPGKSITAYCDGRQVYQLLAPNVTIVAGTYELILQLEVAAASTAGWHTLPNASTPSASMLVAEVQAYS